MEVMRTYSTGLSIQHYPRMERRAVRHKLRAIMKELSNENLQVCQKHNKEVIEFLTDTEFLDQCISDAIVEKSVSKGKFGVNAIMTYCGDSRNHIHSGFHLLQSASKGFVDRVIKFKEILHWMNTYPEELLTWILWHRSTYALHIFTRKWNLNFR